MKLTFSKDFCLWLVPPHDGRVRRYRFSTTRFLALLLVLGVATSALLFIAGDYARVQLLRAKHIFTLQQALREQERLESANENLLKEVTTLKSQSSRSDTYQKDVRERLKQLSNVVRSATALGVLEPRSGGHYAKKLDPESEGIGGAEVDCSVGAGKKLRAECLDVVAPNVPAPSVKGARTGKKQDVAYLIPDENSSDDADLVRTLDNYIGVLKKLPLGLPSSGHISSRYGYRASPFGHGAIKKHEGIDVSLRVGTKIHSTGDGIVREVKWTSTYGLMVDIEHNDSVITRYAHLSRALVQVGSKVKRGQTVALAGSTGRSTGPHLHYEVRVDGKAQNPMKFIQLAQRLEKLVS